MTERPRLNPKIHPEPQIPRERWSLDEVGEIVTRIGNHEAKAALLGLMEPEKVYSPWFLYRLMIEAQGGRIRGREVVDGEVGWPMSSRGPVQFCIFDFEPLGFVDRTDRESFSKNRKGEDIGTPVAGALLTLSERHETSLIKIFGQTASPRPFINTSPKDRIKIFKTLDRLGLLGNDVHTIRLADLAEVLREENLDPGVIRDNIISLGRNGVVNYSSVGPVVDNYSVSLFRSTNKLTSANSAPYKKALKTLTLSLVEIIQRLKDEFTIDQLCELYLDKHPEHRDDFKKGLLSRINSALIDLSRNGYLERNKFGRDVKSEISLDNTQQNLIRDILETVEGIRNLDPLTMQGGRMFAQRLKSDPALVSRLLGRAYKDSKRTGKIPQTRIDEMILLCLETKERATAAEIQKYLLENEIDIARKRIYVYLNRMNKEARIKKTESRNVNFWLKAS